MACSQLFEAQRGYGVQVCGELLAEAPQGLRLGGFVRAEVEAACRPCEGVRARRICPCGGVRETTARVASGPSSSAKATSSDHSTSGRNVGRLGRPADGAAMGLPRLMET